MRRCCSFQFTRHRWNYSASSGSVCGEQQGGCNPSGDGVVSRQPMDGSTLIPWGSVLRWDLKEMLLHRPCHAPIKLCCFFCRSSASQAFFCTVTAVVRCVYIDLHPWRGKREQKLLSRVLVAPSAPSSILWGGNLLSLTTGLMVATVFLRKLLLSICGRTEVE